MSPYKIEIYSPQFLNCPFLDSILNTNNTDFDVKWTKTKDKFLNTIIDNNPDAAIVCFCSTKTEDAEELSELAALIGPKPLLICSQNLTLDFVGEAANSGAKSFFCCKWDKDRIEDVILKVIRCGGIKDFIETLYPESFTHSPHIRKIVDEIVRNFPNRINETVMAERLCISVSWLQKLFRKTFTINYNRFLRSIWIKQALCLMEHSHLDNSEIAFRLHYSQESSMARDFRKEIEMSPTEARRYLTDHTIEELF